MSEELSHPDLYRRRGDSVELLGMKCTSCGYVAFPRQSYGCEKCGAAAGALSNIELSSRGTLSSYATVHMHQAKNIAAPFVIGEVALDAGPTVRATMVEADDSFMQIGARVDGCLHPAPASGEGGTAKLELRFTLSGARA